MNYQFVTDEEHVHLGGNVFGGDPLTFSPKVWSYLIDRFALKSVMDLGSGLGHAASYFHKHGVPTVAVDGMMFNVFNGVYPTVMHDLTKSPFICSVDMVYCAEVVEHIAEEHINNLLQTFTCGSVICMTHALPGQGGYHHVNCKDDDYWIKKMQSIGAGYLDIDTTKIRVLATEEGAIHMARSGLVFSYHKGA